MGRETSSVPYIFGHRRTDDRLFPEIVGIGSAVIPLHGSPRARNVAQSGHVMQRMLIELAVRRSGLPERWLEGLEVELVEDDGTVVLETALCRVAREKPGKDGYTHLFIWTYPFKVFAATLGDGAEILLRATEGHEWSGRISPLLRVA